MVKVCVGGRWEDKDEKHRPVFFSWGVLDFGVYCVIHYKINLIVLILNFKWPAYDWLLYY